MARIGRVVAAALSLYGLYWVFGIVEPALYRATFLMLALALTFLTRVDEVSAETIDTPLDPPRIRTVDLLLVVLSVVVLLWPLADLRAFTARAATPLPVDVAFGAILIVLVLEATRRTVGWVLPAAAIVFIAYAYFGPLLDLVGLGIAAHRGYQLHRLVGMQYMTLEGIFGVPLDVASTYLVLFTLFGAVLERSGAGRFFVDFALAAMGRSRSATSPARAVVGAGFLLGTVSGSGVATTVTLGSCAWPLLKRAGYSPDVAGAVFAASGIGAILAPPALGAAAFLIAEFVGIPYRQVVVMAVIPAIIYFAGVLTMIESDVRFAKLPVVELSTESLGTLTRRYGYFFLAPLTIVVLLASGMSAFRAVTIATGIAVALSFIRAETAMYPRRMIEALEAGGRAIVPVVATTATAGIIVGVMTLTGLGLKLAGIIVTLSGGNPTLTVLLAALAVWTLGLAVPVTASYIIAAVTVVPALTQVGVPVLPAHMFVFYYAVLSEVTPPTALAPFAAAALTGGNPYRTTMLTWKYTLPAFVMPLIFTLSPGGRGLLMLGPPITIVTAAAAAFVALALLWFLIVRSRGQSR